MAIRVGGSSESSVSTQEDLSRELAEFSALVQEAVLVEGRSFELFLSFAADEIKPQSETIIY